MRLSVNNAEPRYFSIASAPEDDLLSFHIRHTGHGFSALAFSSLTEGSDITLEGPMGHGVPAPPERPLLLLAGGIGIAPMLSVIRHRIHNGLAAPVTLYWGVRDKTQIYLHDVFRALADEHDAFSYIPLVSDTPCPGIRNGFAGTAVTEDYDDLSASSIYMAGPRAMIDATMPLLAAKKADLDYVFQDIF